MADILTLKEVELDYEAEEADEGRGEDGTPTPRPGDIPSSSPRTDGVISREDGLLSSPLKNGQELEEGEELEDGELSDEDETAKNERLEPKPVCRFYSKGQCTWGASCRFMHPGVLDKGNYSMFAPPQPILPGEPEEAPAPEKDPIMLAPPAPVHETAWERGLRQAKEMRRRSAKRKEMDVEYEEKKSSMSLTQIELDKENDYYMRPASPAHTYDPYADDDPTDPYDTYHPEVRRIAPPPPEDFVARQGSPPPRRYSQSPPPNIRRVAPPRSPSPREEAGRPRIRGQEDWEDPWMRSREEKRGALGGRFRRRSYSTGSSRSSSSGSSRSRSRKRHYSSSASSRSSSRSRSSTPEGIPRRRPTENQPKEPAVPVVQKNTAPLQKRLAGATPKPVISKNGTGARPDKSLLVPKIEPPEGREKKPERPAAPGRPDRPPGPRPERPAALTRTERPPGPRPDKPPGSRPDRPVGKQDRTQSKPDKGRSSSSESGGSKSPPRRRPRPPQRSETKPDSKESPAKPKDSGKMKEPSKTKEPTKAKEGGTKPSGKTKEPFKMNIPAPKNQIKLTLKTSHTAKPANQTVLEKLGMTNEDLVEAQKGIKRKLAAGLEESGKKKTPGVAQEISESPTKKKKLPETAEKRKPQSVAPDAVAKIIKPKIVNVEVADKDKSKEKKKKPATDAQSRREELLKQLKAVEDAITRKRTKLEK